ncbi:tellurite resistance TerB family protein [aff. Roholtiella sp. LEGE 12411]|uniref:tellurite resistance TerB family protein n=1 Tax=aff. Roholtiella sp. LEGE 12411 TaxID=1828822 RepID=UPI00187FE7C1|nr:tellurite resistance TerB family protein [aff. Roholtiella sp. LEGE 12411]MBE9038042.1 tellurite resistance TerB family protein [aff. Roholtiella sp. LEGE 12411]
MTKYDKIFKSQKTSAESLSPEEAVAAIAVVTAVADSSIEDVDAESLAGILWEFEVFEEYSEDETTEIVDRLIGIVEDEGLGPLFNAAKKALSDELVLDGFAAGVIVLLDEEELTISNQKQPYLKKLQEALELEDEEAEEIIKEVIAAFQEAEDEEYADDEDETIAVENYNQQAYESPLGNFTVPIPVDSQQGGKIQSQEGVVGFSDDFGTLLRIDYYPFPPDQVEELKSVGQEEYFQSILVDKYVPQAIFVNVPDAQVEFSEYLENALEGAYYVLVNMPKGSTISKQENNGTAIRLDAYRGLLTFISGEFLYIVSSQRSFFNGETPGSFEEEAESIKENILEFVETIEFT